MVKTVALFDEAEVLLQVAAGSERAFAVLFRQYSSKVFSFALKLTKSEELAEEVVQEVFIKIWLTREGLGDIREFRRVFKQDQPESLFEPDPADGFGSKGFFRTQQK